MEFPPGESSEMSLRHRFFRLTLRDESGNRPYLSAHHVTRVFLAANHDTIRYHFGSAKMDLGAVADTDDLSTQVLVRPGSVVQHRISGLNAVSAVRKFSGCRNLQ